jgi:hypothetical protein
MKIQILGALLVSSLVAAVAIGCATTAAERPERLPDGTYRLSCAKSLSQCLARFDACTTGFDVVRGEENRRRFGPEPWPDETVASEAVLQCRSPSGQRVSRDTASPVQRAVNPPTACFPGSTQACLGPAGCAGAQVCLPNGAAFGPCDCGPASHSPVPEGTGGAGPVGGGPSVPDAQPAAGSAGPESGPAAASPKP